MLLLWLCVYKQSSFSVCNTFTAFRLGPTGLVFGAAQRHRRYIDSPLECEITVVTNTQLVTHFIKTRRLQRLRR